MVTNTKKVTLGGSWLLLTLLMIGMTWGQAVPAAEDIQPTQAVGGMDAEESAGEDPLGLPDNLITPGELADFGYPAESELIGARTEDSKAFIGEDGKIHVVVFPGPVNYLDEDGAWQEIDLNLKATEFGWEVRDNTYLVQFNKDPAKGVAIQAGNRDPITMGLFPMIVTVENENLVPMPYTEQPSTDPIDVGGNMIRYPLMTGLELDYKVSSTQLKQNLVIREQPRLQEGFTGWFGIAETMILPAEYGLYLGEGLLEDGDVRKTNGSMEVRHRETGDLYITIPAPFAESLIDEEGDPGIRHDAMYIIEIHGDQVVITTLVDTEYLMDENTSYPVLLDPTVNILAQRAGYSYYYKYVWWWQTYTYEYAYSTTSLIYTCRGAGNSYSTCTSSSSYPWFYRYGWYRFDLSNKFTPGSTVLNGAGSAACQGCSVKFESHVGRYRSGARNFDISVIKSGSSQSSSMVDPNSYLYSGGYQLTRYIRTSPASSSSTSIADPGYYWYGGSVKSVTMNLNGLKDFDDAMSGSGGGSSGYVMGLSVRNTANAPMWYWCSLGYYRYYGCTAASRYPHVVVSYNAGADTAPPIADWVPYSDVTTWRTESRTLNIAFTDNTGVDTTQNGGPHLYWRVDNGSYTKIRSTSVGSCAAQGGVWCKFKATIPAVQKDDYVQYFWSFQDIVGSTSGTSGQSPNSGTLPAGGSGTPGTMLTSSTAVLPTTPYWYHANDNAKAAETQSDGTPLNKWQLRVNELNSYSYYNARAYYDQQLTYYEDNREFIWDYDTTSCGTGSNSCFNTASVLDHRYLPSTNYYCTSTSCQNSMKKTEWGDFNSMSAQHGPGSSVLWWYDSTLQRWGMAGLGDSSTGIPQPVSPSGAWSRTTPTYGGGTDDVSVMVPIPDDLTGYFGTFSFNSTYNLNSGNRNWFCLNSNNNPIYFMRNSASNPYYYCYRYYYWYRYDYAWNGWSNPGYDGTFGNGWSTTSKVSAVRPAPDTFPPMIEHNPLMNTYVEEARTVSLNLQDAGDPPSGINVSTSQSEGPHIEYRTYNATLDSNNNPLGWNTWASRSLVPTIPSGQSRTYCEQNDCEWATTIPGTERGNKVEYRIKVQDNKNNWNNTSTYTYELQTPTKTFVIEWHDMTMGFNTQYLASYQVKLYDVTNEIEFEYDTSASMYYDYSYIGYQNQAGTTGEMLRDRGAGYVQGQNTFTNNFRIATSGATTHSAEKYSLGMNELYNYVEEYSGSSNGNPYTYYCMRYFYRYYNQCSTVIDLPNSFDFTYFGTTYEGNSTGKIHAARHGAMQFSTSTSTRAAQMMYYYWGTNFPTLPSSSSYINNVDLAPFFGYYSGYYCYNTGNTECSIRTKMVPFDGAGMDIYNDITVDTTWDLEQSPIRIVPSSDYLRVTANLVIDAGVEVQIMQGKGLDIAGQCSRLTTQGNLTHPVTITNLGNSNAKGIAITNGCSATDDRHMFNNTIFRNMDVAISAGSRHGNNPHYNGNVGNLTFDQATFENVGTAIKHGSGQGTNFDLSGVSITNATGSCIDLPDNSHLRWVGGSATNCNLYGGSSNGVVRTGTGGSVHLEGLTFVDSAYNVIIGATDSLTVKSVTATTSGYVNTQAGYVIKQTSTTSASSIYVDDLDSDGYTFGVITQAADSAHIEDVTLTSMGSGYALNIAPRGSSSSSRGPSGDSGFISNFTSSGQAGSVRLDRTNPSTINNIVVPGSVSFNGNSPSNGRVSITGIQSSGLSIAGCGWNVKAKDVTFTGGVTAFCSSSASSNNLVVMDGTASGPSGNNFAYAYNSVLTAGEIAVTGFSKLGTASTNGELRLIDISFGGTDCVAAPSGSGIGDFAGLSTCYVIVSSSSGKAFFGGKATVYLQRDAVPAADHRIESSLVTTSGTCPNPVAPAAPTCTVTNEFDIGQQITDISGYANVWLVTTGCTWGSSGTSCATAYSDHSFNAAGAIGVKRIDPGSEEYIGNYADPTTAYPVKVGDSFEIELETAPYDIQQDMDCTTLAAIAAGSPPAWVPQGATFAVVNGYYKTSRAKITLSADWNIDGCKVNLQATEFAFNSSSTATRKIVITGNGEFLMDSYDAMANGTPIHEAGSLRSLSNTFGWDIDASGGVATFKEVTISGMRQDSSRGGAFNIDAGQVEFLEGTQVLGARTTSSDMATVKVNGGTLIVDNATISNPTGNGVGLWIEDSAGTSVSNILVRGAVTGIKVKDAAPTIDGFSLTDNTVGIEIDGGMSLPTVYRSTALSGENRGWTTYELDITAFAKNNKYFQMGMNVVYGGGNVHPNYNYYTSKYFAMYDRMRIEVNGNNASDMGTGTSAMTLPGTYPAYGQAGRASNAPPGGYLQYDCNAYGYEYNPGSSYRYGYYWYMMNYASSYSPYFSYSNNGSYYGANAYPSEFGFRVEAVEGLTGSQNYYPYNFWAYYYNSYHGGWGAMMPPEGYNGMWGSYNVCLSYAYTYYVQPEDGWRIAWPVVDSDDIVTQDGAINSVKLYIDILHNRADYYTDRYDFVFRGTGLNDDTTLSGENWVREFGTAAINNGEISGADTGILTSGSKTAAADFDNVTVSAPLNDGLFITGRSSMSINDLTVNGGRYGMRMGSAAAGSLLLTNVDFDSQTQDGAVISNNLNLGFGGTVSNSAGRGVRILSNADGNWQFDGLTLTGNNIGLETAGSGRVDCNDCILSGNSMSDISITNTAHVVALEGTVDTSKVSVTGPGLFERMRRLSATVHTSGGSTVGSAPVMLLDPDSRSVSSGTTDVSGAVSGLTFTTKKVDFNGLTNICSPSCSGYQTVSFAKISYSTSSSSNAVRDFRYDIKSQTLSDNSGNTAAIVLTDEITRRVCYSWTGYELVQQCASDVYYYGGTATHKTASGATIKEYGYYNALDTDMTNQAIMIDAPWTYVSNTKISFNNSIIFTTGTYNSETQISANYPYTSHFYMDNVTMIAIADETEGDSVGFRFGYYGGYSYGQFTITNSKLIKMMAIGTGDGYYVQNGTFIFEDNIVVHHRQEPSRSSVEYIDMCVMIGGQNYPSIKGNTFYDCSVNVFIANNYYAYSTYYCGQTANPCGTRNLEVSNNTFIDSTSLGTWFYLQTKADEIVIKDNVYKGSTILNYGIYTQDATVGGLEISGNTITARNPIYLRGSGQGSGTNYNIDGNTITGDRDSSHACIYVLNGYGDITNNNCLDADGGVDVDQIRSGNDVHVTGNTLSMSSGRVAPSALGFNFHSCGRDKIWAGDNDVSTMANALIVNGCDVTDNGSKYTAIGGAAGAVHTVNVGPSTYTPGNITVNAGDTVRWHAVEYYNDVNNYIHTVTADNGQNVSFDSGGMNNGSWFSFSFQNEGTYSYHCSAHSFMTGNVTVQAASGSSNLATTGIDIQGGNDDIVFNAVEITGFGYGYEQSGGSLTMAKNTYVQADRVGADLENVDVTINGASLNADSGYGIGLDTSSNNGQHKLQMTDLSVSGSVGALVNTHGAGSGAPDFRWNGGTSAATTTLKTTGGASGDIENMTWPTTTTQIAAGADSIITSIGNTLDPSKITIHADATIHEGNLLSLDVLHMGNVPSTAVGVQIKSTDGARADSVTPLWRKESPVVDGDLGDWDGDMSQNIADDLMPGLMGGTSARGISVTWQKSSMDDNLYISLSGFNFETNGDLQIYFDSTARGSRTGDSWYEAHRLPFEADYLLWAENGGSSNNWGMRQRMPAGNWAEISGSRALCGDLRGYIGHSTDTNSEFRVPFSCIGSPVKELRFIAIIQNEGDAGIQAVFPTQTIAAGTGAQTFGDSNYIGMTSQNLAANDGTMTDYRLIYKSFLGSTIAGPTRDYNIEVKVKDDRGIYWDWGEYTGLQMDTNRLIEIDILRARPVIQNLDPLNWDEDSGSHTVSMTGYAEDQQDVSSAMTWTLTTNSRSTDATAPLTYSQNGHDLTVASRPNQFGNHLLDVTVTDSHGLTASSVLTLSMTNVNDAPVICNTARSDCTPELNVDSNGLLNVINEGAKKAGITVDLGTRPNATDPQTLKTSLFLDMSSLGGDEQKVRTYNGEAMPQMYSWNVYISSGYNPLTGAAYAATDTDGDGWLDTCDAFSVKVERNQFLKWKENLSNEAGGTCDITLNLTDNAGVNAYATELTFSFTVNPVNDAPLFRDFDSNQGHVVSQPNGNRELDWDWEVTEDDTNADNLTFNIKDMLSDNDTAIEDLSLAIAQSSRCTYTNYFSIAVDNNAHSLRLGLIKDAATDAPGREIDYLDDNGIHQIKPASGVYCTVNLWLNDTISAPSYINYTQTSSGVYKMQSKLQVIRIRVINIPEPRPDYNFDEEYGFNFHHVQGVLAGTRIPVTVNLEHDGDEPPNSDGTYKYKHDLYVKFYTDDDPRTVQSQVRIGCNGPYTGQAASCADDPKVLKLAGFGNDVLVKASYIQNSGTSQVRAFVDIKTVCPTGTSCAGSYIPSSIRRPSLEDHTEPNPPYRWTNNNQTTNDTSQKLPKIINLQPAEAVASFAPSFIAVSVVGMFVGAMLLKNRREEDDEEFEEDTMEDDEMAVSPVIATILLVAITVVLAGVIYVWAGQLADVSTKAPPRLTFDPDARYDHTSDQNLWYWKLRVTYAANELATQAIFVTVEWDTANGAQFYKTTLANRSGVYGFIPSNSDKFVTFFDNIDLQQSRPITTFGVDDSIQVRMMDPDGNMIERAVITVSYEPAGRYTPLATFTGTSNPPKIG